MEVEEGRKKEKADIDEGLYSRQLYVMGHEAQKRMGGSSVLVVGMNGLGVEIAKNVVLAGVKSVTVYDNKPTEISDLGSQFYLKEEDIGKPRSGPSAARLGELNEYVIVDAYSGNLMDKEFIAKFTVVVVADDTLKSKLALNEICRQVGAKFICCQISGLFANAFCDFGDEFTVLDTNGEQPISRMISTIIPENPGVVTVHDESRHGLETGALVRFSEVKGMTELNDLEPVRINVKGPYTFEIDVDTSKFNEYKSGGYVHEVKQPKVMSFKPLHEALRKPGEFLLTDFAKFGRSELLFFAFMALDKFRESHAGSCPEPGNLEQCNEVFKIVQDLAAKANAEEDEECVKLDEDGLDEKAKEIVIAFASGACAELSPMAAFLGGVVGQEVLKACSGKFTPLHQFLFFDAMECLPDEYPLPLEEVKPVGSRYDGQIAVFGKTFVKKLNSLNMFLVGAGAIGCEMIKNWAMMGVAIDSSKTGQMEDVSDKGPGVIHITDMDKIERSNLNRQFLFRNTDVGSSKSVAASRAAAAMNAAINVKPYEDKVAPDTETIFGDDFFTSLDVVCTALDNVEARLYVDNRCLNYAKPMLESGTLGTKGNTQVVVPHLTENYGASRDPPEKSVPICTLKNFPYEIAHCVQWARDWFEGAYSQMPMNVNQYITNPDFMSRLDAQQNVKVQTLEELKSALVSDKPKDFSDCIKWARLQFEEQYANQIKQLLFNFPPGMKTSTGALFWSGTKRQPTPLEFDMEDETHLDFVVSGANLRAFIYGIPECRDIAVFREAIPRISVPPFKPKSNMKIASNDSELKDQSDDMLDVDTLAQNLLKELPTRSDLADTKVVEVAFEKDDDTNFHMDFVTAASNLRARNYGIGEADKHETKRVAGKIIPAIATTTALVTGLVCLELYKLVAEKKTVEAYKNGFCNLALPFFAFSEPIEVKKTIAGELAWSIWDKIDIDGTEKEYTLADFLQYFQDNYSVEVSMLSYGVSILHSFFSQPSKKAERMKMTMTELVENVTKKQIDPNAKFLAFEVICVDKDENDAELPPVRYRIRK